MRVEGNFSHESWVLCFRFTSPLDHDKVLLEGSRVLDDTTLAIEPWTPSFSTFIVIFAFGSDLVPLVRLATNIVDSGGVETDCYPDWAHQVGPAIELLFKGRFTKVAIEVDLSHPFVPVANIDVEIFFPLFLVSRPGLVRQASTARVL